MNEDATDKEAREARLTSYRQSARRVAVEAGQMALAFFRRPGTHVVLKEDGSPVTEADRAIEQKARALLARDFPHHAIAGEEFGVTRPSSGSSTTPEDPGDPGDYCWVVDPIDGTQNFIAGLPLFGCLVGLCFRGEPLTGAFYSPFSDELWSDDGMLWTQRGAVLKQSLKTCGVPSLRHAILHTSSPHYFRTARDKSRFETLRQACRHVRYGADCYAIGALCLGSLHLVAEAGLKPYDILPLVPIVRAAGGVVTDWEGKALSLSNSDRVLIGATASLHREALACLA